MLYSARGKSPPKAQPEFAAEGAMSEDSANSKVLDPNTIGQLLELSSGQDQSLIADYIDLYLKQAAGLVEQIGRHAAEGKSEALEAAAHKLKGSSLNIGARQLAEACLALEERGQKEDLADAGALTERMQSCYGEVVEELARVKARLDV